MRNQLMLLFVGFLLTTVLGGILGSLFQTRSWKHQHQIQVREQRRQQAVAVFEEVSRLLDKRLYRLRQLFWQLRPDMPPSDAGTASERMTDYRSVLYEWNDGINRNLALLQEYFGSEIRNGLDYNVGKRLRDLGGQVEPYFRRDRPPPPPTSTVLEALGASILELNEVIYAFNLQMLAALAPRGEPPASKGRLLLPRIRRSN